MVETGNCDSVSLMYKNCPEPCSPVGWCGKSPCRRQFTLLSLSQVTLQTKQIIYVVLSWTSATKLCSGWCFPLCSCLGDSVLTVSLSLPFSCSAFSVSLCLHQNTPFYLHVVPSWMLTCASPPLRSWAVSYGYVKRKNIDWMFCLCHKLLKMKKLSALLHIFVKIIWKKERGKKSRRRKVRWKTKEVVWELAVYAHRKL